MAAKREQGGMPARERILSSAYDLFSQHGVRAIGIDAIIKHSGVARMTLYRNFTSKNALVLAFLKERRQRWVFDWLENEVLRRASTPRDRLLAIFDVFGEWFERDDFEGCSFVNVMLETADRSSALHEACVEYLAEIRSFVAELAEDAGIRYPDDFAGKWHLLMKGSIVSAAEGDLEAAGRARAVGQLLLDHELD